KLQVNAKLVDCVFDLAFGLVGVRQKLVRVDEPWLQLQRGLQERYAEVAVSFLDQSPTQMKTNHRVPGIETQSSLEACDRSIVVLEPRVERVDGSKSVPQWRKRIGDAHTLLAQLQRSIQ